MWFLLGLLMSWPFQSQIKATGQPPGMPIGEEGTGGQAQTSISPEALLAPGSAMFAYDLPDQHGQRHAFQLGTRWVVVSFEKRTGILARRWLREKPEDYLEDNHIDFIAEISRIPEKLANNRVLPKIREYPRQVLLADGGEVLARIPQQRGALTIIQLSQGGEVVKIAFPRSQQALEALIEHGD